MIYNFFPFFGYIRLQGSLHLPRVESRNLTVIALELLLFGMDVLSRYIAIFFFGMESDS